MNLRTRGILLSVLPLAMTILLMIPEIAVQNNTRQAVEQARTSNRLSAVAHNFEESALNAGSAMREIRRAQPGTLAHFNGDLIEMEQDAAQLQALSLEDADAREAAIPVGNDALAYALLARVVAADIHGHAAPALLVEANQNLATMSAQLRSDVRSYDAIAHNAELGELGALDAAWKLSLLLVVVFIVGLASTSALLVIFSGRAIDAILKLENKTERYRRGEPLGKPSLRRDEIGRLDAAVHEFVAEHRHRERELTRYRLLAEVTHDIILFVDRISLKVIDANPAALAAYGYADLIGRSTKMLHAAEDPIDNETIALSDRPEGLSYEGLHQRADGTVFPVEVHARTAEVEGRLTVIKTIRDITERRRAAEQVARALDHAVEASRLKSEFVATMSHEIRTPMHGVIGMSELLLETPLMPAQREYAVTVKESAQALLAIVDDILDFSKLEANKIELERVAFDPAQLVASAVNLARGTARDKGLTLQSTVSPHVPSTVSGDPTRLRQVLINLIGNAVKFTGSGTVSVATSVERDDGRAVFMKFAVSDTGIGVNPEAKEHLFEAFVQGDGSTTRRFGGSGLGLSISRRLVELMGGRIWLGEHEGPGATFCFTARFERTSEAVIPAKFAAGALRVLALDDDENARRTFGSMLAGWGLHHASAPDIVSARAQLLEAAQAGNPFDVVLIDYVLPRGNGAEFAAELGIRPEYGSPARILVTAFDAVGRKEAAIAAGCAAYLQKPIDPSDLYNAVSDIERRRKPRISALGEGRRRARILMAEDSALVRRVAGFQLEELDYAVDIVENGVAAVEAVETGNYELVLMDMRMPEMDGLSATRAIRAAERTTGRHIVVIALTANVLEGDRAACTEAGMDDFLAKPLRLEALRAALERWLPEQA